MDSIQYLQTHLRRLVDVELVKLAEGYAAGSIAGRGHFSIPREAFCYIDYLGEIASGDSGSTKRAVSFIRRFFPPAYSDYAELLCAMWRHGTVHAHRPYSVRAPLPQSSTSVEVRWLSANHNRPRERGVHLLPFPIDGRQDAVYLVMNTVQFANDLLSAIDSFIDELRNDIKLKVECDKRLAMLDAVRDYTFFRGCGHQQAIATEIAKAWAARGGLISEAGSVMTAHPKERQP